MWADMKRSIFPRESLVEAMRARGGDGVFNSLGWPELAVMLVIGLFVIGPERLPSVAAQAGRGLRSLRTYARGLRDDLADDLGPEIREVNLRSLSNPRALLVKHVLAEETPRRASSATSTTALPVPQQQGGPSGPGTTTSEGGNHG